MQITFSLIAAHTTDQPVYIDVPDHEKEIYNISPYNF